MKAKERQREAKRGSCNRGSCPCQTLSRAFLMDGARGGPQISYAHSTPPHPSLPPTPTRPRPLPDLPQDTILKAAPLQQRQAQRHPRICQISLFVCSHLLLYWFHRQPPDRSSQQVSSCGPVERQTMHLLTATASSATAPLAIRGSPIIQDV